MSSQLNIVACSLTPHKALFSWSECENNIMNNFDNKPRQKLTYANFKFQDILWIKHNYPTVNPEL